MSEVLKQARVRHVFGGEEAVGWVPPNAARPNRTSEVAVDLAVAIIAEGHGFVLQWDGPTAECSGDNWYQELADAEHAAVQLFGIGADDWQVTEVPATQQQLPYRERFPIGSCVRIADRAMLDEFRANWRYNNPLTQEQLAYASHETEVQELGFYHGGEVLYRLKDIPGVWHEACLVASAPKAVQ